MDYKNYFVDKNIALVILAGGCGNRFGSDKLLEYLNDKPLLLYSVTYFRKFINDKNIFLVFNNKNFYKYKNIINDFIPDNSINFIFGGSTRVESVFNCICNLPNFMEMVAIHDAVRPLATIELLKKCTDSCINFGSGVSAVKIYDTLKLVNNNIIIKTIDRENMWKIQTPQVFRLYELIDAYKSIINKRISVTDDSEIMEISGHKVYLVENDSLNEKITCKDDLNLIKSYLKL